jgi:hypothetical protein
LIRDTLGFGVVDIAGIPTQFDQVPGYNQFSNSRILTAPGGPGAGGSLFMWFSTFGVPTVTRIFDPQTRWVVGMNCQQTYADSLGGVGPAQQNRVLVGSDASGEIVGLQFNIDGTLSVMDLINDLVICTTTDNYPVASWAPYIELRSDGWGTAVSFALWVGDAKKAFGSSTLSGRIVDRWSFTNQAVPSGLGGAQWADRYILDGQGSAPWNDRLGPVRITTQSPIADASGRWAIFPSTNAHAYLSINDLPSGVPGGDPNGSPDGDFSYLTPNSLGSAEFFQVAPAPCYGRVLGVSVNICFRGTSGSAGIDALLLQNSTIYNLGTVNVTGDYHTEQVFVGLSKTTGQYFVDSEISGSFWGFSTSSSLDVRVTQLFLEKIVSLRNVAFGCGSSSYSY